MRPFARVLGYCPVIPARPPRRSSVRIIPVAVPGRWEGDLLIGARQGSSIATLVERRAQVLTSTRIAVDPRAYHLHLDSLEAFARQSMLSAVALIAAGKGSASGESPALRVEPEGERA